MKTIAPVLATMLLAVVASPSAQALDLLSTTGTGPVGNCQPATPSQITQIRRRPLAVINEGSQIEFATCAFETEEVSLNVVGFNTRLTNLSEVTVTVNCSGVVGDEAANAQYFPKTLVLAPGASGTLSWSAADNGGLLFTKSVALSCALPPFVGLNRNRITTLISIL